MWWARWDLHEKDALCRYTNARGLVIFPPSGSVPVTRDGVFCWKTNAAVSCRLISLSFGAAGGARPSTFRLVVGGFCFCYSYFFNWWFLYVMSTRVVWRAPMLIDARWVYEIKSIFSTSVFLKSYSFIFFLHCVSCGGLPSCVYLCCTVWLGRQHNVTTL